MSAPPVQSLECARLLHYVWYGAMLKQRTSRVASVDVLIPAAVLEVMAKVRAWKEVDLVSASANLPQPHHELIFDCQLLDLT